MVKLVKCAIVHRVLQASTAANACPRQTASAFLAQTIRQAHTLRLLPALRILIHVGGHATQDFFVMEAHVFPALREHAQLDSTERLAR